MGRRALKCVREDTLELHLEECPGSAGVQAYYTICHMCCYSIEPCLVNLTFTKRNLLSFFKAKICTQVKWPIHPQLTWVFLLSLPPPPPWMECQSIARLHISTLTGLPYNRLVTIYTPEMGEHCTVRVKYFAQEHSGGRKDVARLVLGCS